MFLLVYKTARGATVSVENVESVEVRPQETAQSPQQTFNFRGDMSQPLGIRNNNPCNLRTAGIAYKGKIGESSGGYGIFDTPVNGLRAACLDLYLDMTRDLQNTVRSLITEFAPHGDNNPTNAYIQNVCARMGVTPDQKLSYHTHIKPLLKAIVFQENGKQPYPERIFDEAIRAAGK